MPLATATRELNTQPQPQLSPPAYVVLGMVGLGARSGYEIKQTVEQSIRFFWTISQAQSYPSLQQLERQGLITGRAEPRGKRNRRVFEITDSGQTVLEQWLRAEQPLPFELRDIAMVKLFFADALSSEDALALLARVRQRGEQQIATLEQIEPAAQLVEQEGNVHPLLTLHIGIAFHRAMINVCREFEPKLTARARG